MTLFANALLARIMGVDEFGNYAFLMAWVLVLGLIARLGMDNTLLRFIPAYISLKEYDRLKGIIHWSTRIVILSGSVIALTYIAISIFLNRLSLAMFISSLIIPVIALTQLRAFSLRAVRRVIIAQFPEMILNPSLVILGSITILLFFRNVDSSDAIALTLLSTTISFLLCSYFLSNSIAEKIRDISSSYLPGYWLKVSIPLLLVSGTSIVIAQSDVLMLGIIRDTSIAGIYSVTSRIATLVSFGLVVVNALAAPLIAESFSLNNTESLSDTAQFSAKIGFFTVLPSVTIVIIFGQEILEFFGPDFIRGYSALIILTAGQLINVLCGSVGFLLTMTGNELVAAKMLGISAILNLILNAMLIPHFGAIGAAFATTFATALWNILLLVKVVGILKINPTIFHGSARKLPT